MNFILFHIGIRWDSSLGYRLNNTEIRVQVSAGAKIFLFSIGSMLAVGPT
jgi:hypothetical protein